MTSRWRWRGEKEAEERPTQLTSVSVGRDGRLEVRLHPRVASVGHDEGYVRGSGSGLE